MPVINASATDPNKILPIHYPWAREFYRAGVANNWTPEEISLFTHHAWQPVTLGPRILRAETAAIAAIAIAATHFI